MGFPLQGPEGAAVAVQTPGRCERAEAKFAGADVVATMTVLDEDGVKKELHQVAPHQTEEELGAAALPARMRCAACGGVARQLDRAAGGRPHPARAAGGGRGPSDPSGAPPAVPRLSPLAGTPGTLSPWGSLYSISEPTEPPPLLALTCSWA